ncbi:15288_t:CDS:10 [Dentiscutata erythropus]|uniref:15288_t:CDS:1 n=1 Tax=Dentiscutata erythropus TaxID=1348616 RepID=A0A9N9BJ21_9GLOM|nr:15288_t:CDS:10 [Dentiscutata erythropus]
MATEDELIQVRQELALVRLSYEQQLHQSQTRCREFQVINESQKQRLNEYQQLAERCEQEKQKALNDCKTANEEADNIRFEIARMEMALQEEKASRLALITNKDQELNQTKEAYEQVAVLRSQYQQQIFDLQNELQSSRRVISNKVTIADMENESLKNRISSMEKDLMHWQALTRNTTESKNKEIDNLNGTVEKLAMEHDTARQQANQFQLAYKEQLVVNQRLNIEKEDKERFHKEVIDKVMAEGQSLKRLNEIYEKRQQEDKEAINRAQREIADLQYSLSDANNKLSQSESEIEKLNEDIRRLEDENKHLSQISSVSSVSPGSAVSMALQSKGKSIVQMYSEYSKLQEQLLQERRRNRELTEALTTFNKELENYPTFLLMLLKYTYPKFALEKTPLLHQRTVEYNQMVAENQAISEQLRTCHEEIQQLQQSVTNLQSENVQITDRNNQLQNEKEEYIKHNSILIRQVDEFRGGTPSSPKMDIDEDNKPYDVDSLYRLSFNLKAEKKSLMKKISTLENQIKVLQDQITLKDSENQSAVQEISRLQMRQRQLCSQIESLERERGLHQELTLRGSVSSISSIQDGNTSIRSIPATLSTRGRDYEAEIADLKTRLEISLQEMKTLDESLQKANQELSTLHHEQLQYKYDRQSWEERYKVIQGHLSIKEEECQNTKSVLRQIQKLNEQMEKQMTKAIDENSLLNVEVTNLKNDLSSQQIKWEESQKRFNKEMDDLIASKGDAENLARNVQNLSEEKERIESEFKVTQEKLLAAQAKCDNLQEQLVSMSEKYSNALKKSTEEHSKFVESNKALQNKITELEGEIRNRVTETETLTKEIQELKNQLSVFQASDQGIEIVKIKTELETKEKELVNIRDESRTYKDLYEKYQTELKNYEQRHNELKSTTDEEREANLASIKKLQDELYPVKEELDQKIDELRSKDQELTIARNEVIKLEQMINEIRDNSNNEKHQLREEMTKQEKLLEEAQNKYNREVLVHAEDAQSILALNSRHAQLKSEFDQLKIQLQRSEEIWNSEKDKLEKELEKTLERCKELEESNKTLHDYFDTDAGKTISQDQIISLLRMEKEKAETQREAFAQQAERYRAQYEHTQKSLDEVRALLIQEREQAEKTGPLEKLQTELSEKNIQLKLLEESNQTLRAASERLEKQVTTSESSLKEAEEKVQALDVQIKSLQLDRDSSAQETKILKEDNERWKNRFHTVLQKYGISDPTELQHLKDNLKSTTEDRDKLKAENGKLRNDFTLARKQAVKIKNKLDQTEKEKSAITQDKANLEKDKATLTQELTKEKTNHDNLRKRVSNMQSRFKNLAQAEQTKKELEELKQKHQDVSKELEELKQKHQDASKELEELKQQSTKQIEGLKKELQDEKEKTSDYLRYKAQESMFSSKIKKLEAEKAELKNQINQFQQQQTTSQQNIPKSDTVPNTTEITSSTPPSALPPPTLPPPTLTLPALPPSTVPPSTLPQVNITKPPTASQPTSTALTIIPPSIDVSANAIETKELPQSSNNADANDGTIGAATSPTLKQVAVIIPSVPAVTLNVPKEKPPVKLQRNRVPLTVSQSPKITPVQVVVSTPPPIEEQQPVARTLATSESHSSETSAVESSEPVIVIQPASTEVTNSSHEIIGRKRSRDDSEDTSTGNEVTEMQDVQTSDNSNTNVEVVPQSPVNKNIEEVTDISESVENNNQVDTNESVEQQPSPKRVKVEDSSSDA